MASFFPQREAATSPPVLTNQIGYCNARNPRTFDVAFNEYAHSPTISEILQSPNKCRRECGPTDSQTKVAIASLKRPQVDDAMIAADNLLQEALALYSQGKYDEFLLACDAAMKPKDLFHRTLVNFLMARASNELPDPPYRFRGRCARGLRNLKKVFAEMTPAKCLQLYSFMQPLTKWYGNGKDKKGDKAKDFKEWWKKIEEISRPYRRA